MYLKSLTLKGFKSFADKTTMLFDPGLSVVVGPNGSGKSNVSDAILWVLGEQSAKQLRGQAMGDVIFQGSSARHAVGLAEVTLVLDNSDHTLPVDFIDVAITRRMYSSGESEYLICGAPARLMDVQDILHDSGLGKDTHSIISQGKLDSVLSSKPEDRRSLIEEAAGISKHRRRKERSERKLKSMDESVRRARDLDREIKRQLRPLERQVDKALRFKDLDARRAHLTTVLAVDDVRRVQEDWEALSKKRLEAEAAVELASYRSLERAQNLEKLQSMLEQKGLFVGDLGEQRRRVHDQLGRIESDMRLLEEKGRNMVAKHSDTRMQLSAYERRRKTAADDLEHATSELTQVQAKRHVLKSRLADLEPAANQAEAARLAAAERVSAVQAELRAAQRAYDAATLEHARLNERLANAKTEDALFEGRLTQIADQLAADTEALVAARARAEESRRAAAEARAELTQLKREIASAQATQQEARAAADAVKSALAELRATQAALTKLDAYNPAESRLAKELAALPALAAHFRGHVAQTFQVNPAFEPLVELLLGDALGAFIVTDDKSAAHVAEAARTLGTKQGAALVAVANATPTVPFFDGAPGIPLVSQLASAPEDAPLIHALLGAVHLVDTPEEALAAHRVFPHAVFATPDGQYVTQDGLLHVGVPQNAQAGTLERKRRLRTLAQEIPVAEAELELANEAFAEARALRSRLAEGEQALRSAISKNDGAADLANREASRLESAQARATAELHAVQKRRDEARAKTAEAASRVDELAKTQAESLSQTMRLSAELDELTSAAKALQEEAQTQIAAAQEATLELATLTERRRHLKSQCAQLERTLAENVAAIEAATLASNSLEVLKLRIDPLHERYEALSQEVRIRAERLRNRASLAEADSASLKDTIGKARAEAAAAKEELDRAQATLAELNVQAGKLEVKVESSVRAVQNLGAMPLEEALALPSPEDRAATQRELDQVTQAIQNLGPINQVAMDHYQTLKDRSNHIAAQLADLEAARASLTKIQQAIERKMRKTFMGTFEAVNANFKEVYGMLFPGGTANLELTDPDHPFATGIEVIAVPRGKRISKLALLSGGERSLTALALLFAVYRTRTVPFYVFDEVEAALDDSNLDKLLGAIQKLKQQTQLIVISHQRRTMEQADVLWGVSMQADGVSHVVSERLDHATGKVVDAT